MKPKPFAPPHIPDLRQLEQTQKVMLERVRAVLVAKAAWQASHPQASPLSAIAHVRALALELERSTTHQALSDCLGRFVSTMMGYENEVLGLEESGHLPPGFAAETYRTFLKLQKLIPSPPLPRAGT